ncbi:hypothetical protein JHK84_028720 [Glycine max]|nr:hypothetical protein JHK84_028720 [Glycine max]
MVNDDGNDTFQTKRKKEEGRRRKKKNLVQRMARPTKIKVLVSILEMEDDLILVAELAGELWDAGVKAEFFLNKSTLSMQTNQGSLGWYLLVSGK